MNIHIKGTNIELTDAITEYVNKKIQSIEKFLPKEDVYVYVEVGKTTNHHKNGEFYKAEFDITSGAIRIFAKSEELDLYASIDAVREEVVRKMNDIKDKKQTLFKRGATSVKKMLKGLSKRNPFTSKY